MDCTVSKDVMSLSYGPDMCLVLPEAVRQAILDHCRRSLAAFREGRSAECKAFGLICGTVADQVVTAAECLPLHKNVRSQSPHKERMDKVMAEYAIPSETPLTMRGWVADPAELFARIRECRERGETLLGTYHMHRLGWPHDPLRDTPTRLDEVLARESGLLMFIISMVEPDRPIIRVFFEGNKEQELLVR